MVPGTVYCLMTVMTLSDTTHYFWMKNEREEMKIVAILLIILLYCMSEIALHVTR